MKDTATAENVQSAQRSPLVFAIGDLWCRLASLKDKRGRRGQRYPLAVVLLLAALAKLSGQDKPSGIASWVRYRQERLQKALDILLPKTPHHNTFRRVFESAVDPDEVDKIICEFLTSLPGVGVSVLISIDGKTVRGTIDLENLKGEHLLAAYLPEEGIVLCQVAVGSKGNEISAAPKLLAAIDLRGKVVCGDALHTQRQLSVQILEAGGDYLWFVKDNQPTLREEIRQVFQADDRTVMGGRVPNDFRHHRTVDKGHGRLETRTIRVSSDLKGHSDWPGLQQVFELHRRRVNCSSGEVDQEIAYGLTSMSEDRAGPKVLLQMSRSYWGIENGLHNRRDQTFHEDATRMTRGNTGRLMAALNNLLIGILSYAGYTNFAEARREWDAKLPEVLTLGPASLLT